MIRCQTVKNKLVCFLWASMACIISLSVSALEQSTDSLFDDRKLSLKVWVEPENNIVVSQQVNLYIEVATHRWFMGGTKIGLLEIDDAIVLRRDNFAVNSSRREAGENWAVQLWTLTVYPQREGEFIVPDIPITVTVSGEDNKPVTGTLHSHSFTFNASIPTEVMAKVQQTEGKLSWLATPLLEVSEAYIQDIEALRVGDTLQRTVHFKADNVAAMMLPAPEFAAPEGVSIYQKPPLVNDKINRGDYFAERLESISYVIEKSGEYSLPELTFYWWDLNSQQIKTVVLPEQILSISRGGLTNEWPANFLLKIVATVFIIVLVTVIALHWFKRRQAKPEQLDGVARKLKINFVEACQSKNYSLAVSLLYQWLDFQAMHNNHTTVGIISIRKWLSQLEEKQLQSQFNQLVERAYGQQTDDNKVFDKLLAEIEKSAKGVTLPALVRDKLIKPIELRLN